MKNKIENSLLLIILTRSIFLLFFSKNSLIDLILSLSLSLILIIIYQKLNLKKYNIIKLFLLIIFIILSLLTITNITYFIKDNILDSYSYLIIFISFLFLSIYLTIKGYHTYIKTLELSTYILITMFIFSTILLIPYININNLIKITIQPSFNFIYFSILILFIYIAINYLNNYQLNYKTYLFSSINIIFIKLLIISILGKTLENLFDYPYISIYKKISYFDFFERLEGIFALQYLFDYLFLFTLFTLTIKFLLNDLKKTLRKT